MQSEELNRKAIAFDDMSPDESIGAFGGSGQWVELCTVRDLRALEAALSAAEPVATVAEMGAGGMRVLMPHPPGSADHLPIGTKLYAAPPAPSVAVKALEWDETPHHAYNNAFGYHIAVIVDRVVLRGPLTASSEHKDIPAAKAAAQADYEARIRSALSAQVQDVAGDEEWQLVPKHPTGRMIDAVVSMVDDYAPHPFVLNLYRAMIAAAPAKQEGGTNE